MIVILILPVLIFVVFPMVSMHLFVGVTNSVDNEDEFDIDILEYDQLCKYH